jgi:hypothetical protein
MTEQQSDYVTEAMDMLHHNENVRFKDESNDKKYFTITPRIVKEYARNSHDLALWETVKDVAGESGECYLNTEQLAILSGISTGQVSNSRKYWVKIGFLKGEIRKDPGYSQGVWHLSVPDIWAKNIMWCEKHPKIEDRLTFRKAHRSLHRMNPSLKPSGSEGKPSGSETKKILIKKNTLTEGDATEAELQQMKYDLIAMQFNKNTRPYLEEFYNLSGLLPEGKKRVKEWQDACGLLYGARLPVEDMSAAFQKQVDKEFTIKDPGSLMTNMQQIKMRREKGLQTKGAPATPKESTEELARRRAEVDALFGVKV